MGNKLYWSESSECWTSLHNPSWATVSWSHGEEVAAKNVRKLPLSILSIQESLDIPTQYPSARGLWSVSASRSWISCSVVSTFTSSGRSLGLCSLIVVTLSPTFCFYLNVHGDFEGLENHNAVITTTLDNMDLGWDDHLGSGVGAVFIIYHDWVWNNCTLCTVPYSVDQQLSRHFHMA